jgi:hypothetical protein
MIKNAPKKFRKKESDGLSKTLVGTKNELEDLKSNLNLI